MTPEKWISVCGSLRLQSGPALVRAIDSLRDELATWPASVRRLDEKDAWLEGIFEGKFDPRLALVGHATIRQKGESSYSGFALGDMLEIIRAFAHHLDPSFDPPATVLEDESNFVSAYGCGGGGATKRIGSEKNGAASTRRARNRRRWACAPTTRGTCTG